MIWQPTYRDQYMLVDKARSYGEVYFVECGPDKGWHARQYPKIGERTATIEFPVSATLEEAKALLIAAVRLD